jgi:predicted CXXCH cytochrome family protein
MKVCGTVQSRSWCACLQAGALLLSLLAAGCGKSEESAERERANAEASSTEQLLSEKKKRETFVPVAPLPKPATVPAGASCVTPACHASLATAAHIHQPVARNSCDACHDKDAGGHRYPLLRKGDEMCTFCHAVSGSRQHQHQGLEQGCQTCHRPHESRAKFLLKEESVERQCASCHDVPLKRFAHGPFAQGQCSLCHEPHESENRKLLRGGEGTAHCFMCHTEFGQEMKKAGRVHEPAAKDCVTCHDPHSADNEHELRQPIGENCVSCHEGVSKVMKDRPVKHAAMTSEKQCVNCHSPHASNHGSLLPRRMDAVCLTCHGKPVTGADGRKIPNMKRTLSSKFLHGPAQQGGCGECHEVHGSEHRQLLTREFPVSFYAPFALERYALCFSCHDSQLVVTPKSATLTEFRDGDRNLHYVHVHQDEKGRTCKTCHAVHGSDLPRHMASSVPFEGSNWAMPIRYEATADGGRCAPGCHEPQTYRRGPAAAAGERK